MLRFILLAILATVVARAFWRLMDGVMEAAGGPRASRRAQPPGVKLMRDPVCGTYVAPGSALSATAGGTTHYFCSERCQREFRKR